MAAAKAARTSYESAYNHPGIAITVSSGDGGYGVEFPASSPHVTAVGGTHLVTASNSRGWTETAWSGAGSGCSTVYAKPSWQHDTGCSKRTVADVSAVADPNTGVAVYGPTSSRQSGWLVFGGTSVAAPLIAGVYGVNGGAVNYGSDPYANPLALFDVTSAAMAAAAAPICAPRLLAMMARRVLARRTALALSNEYTWVIEWRSGESRAAIFFAIL